MLVTPYLPRPPLALSDNLLTINLLELTTVASPSKPSDDFLPVLLLYFSAVTATITCCSNATFVSISTILIRNLVFNRYYALFVTREGRHINVVGYTHSAQTLTCDFILQLRSHNLPNQPNADTSTTKMKLSNMIGALGVAALAFSSNTVDASTAATQTSGHLRHQHHRHGHNHRSGYDNDDDGDSSDYGRRGYSNQRGRRNDDVDSRGVYNSGGNRNQRGYGGAAAELNNYGSPANSGATASAGANVSNGGPGLPATAAATAGNPLNAGPGVNQGAGANAKASNDAANGYSTGGAVPKDMYAQQTPQTTVQTGGLRRLLA